MNPKFLPKLLICSVVCLNVVMVSVATGKCHPVLPNSEKYHAETQCKGYVMDCSGQQLTSIPTYFPDPGPEYKPPMCLLDLSHNQIKNVTNNAFQNLTNVSSILFLYLSNNEINFLAKDSFIGLENLQYINLSKNALEWTNEMKTSISRGVFEPLKNLKWINLKENAITTYDGLDKELQHLKSLEGLFINGCKRCKFGRYMNNLKNLVTLNFAGRFKRSCIMRNLSDDLFEHFNETNITNISLASCNIREINNRALQPFNKSLVNLDISYNEQLTFSGMNLALGGLKYSNKLERLNVNRIHSQYERGTELQEEHVENLHTLRTLKHLFMDLNKLEVIDYRILWPYLLPTSLTKITLAGNRLSVGKYVFFIPFVKGLESLDISRQHLNFDPFYSTHFEPNTQNFQYPDLCSCSMFDTKPFCVRLWVPEGLKDINWNQSFLHTDIPYTRVCNGGSLKTVDLSFNLLTVLEGPVIGVESVIHLDLSQNLCRNISNVFLEGFKSLEFLNLSRNQLGAVLSPKNTYARDVFKQMKTLVTLDLSDNKINKLWSDLFTGLENLQQLHLSNNNLDIWNIDLSHSTCLRFLALGYNGLESLPKYLQTYLDKLTSAPCNKGTNVTVGMYRNPVQCTCYTVPFLKWMLYSKVFINFTNEDECRLKDGERLQLLDPRNVTKLVKELQQACVDYSWLVATGTSVMACLITTAITLIVYRKRWKLRHMYYSRKRRHVHKGYQRLFTYDSFVSYSEGMAKFVKDKMVPALEEERGLKLWVGDRNSHPGASVAENIVHAMLNSKKSIHVIDKDYMDDKWCNFEINMAYVEAIESKRDFLILVVIGARSTDMPLNIMRLLDTQISLRYPLDGNADEIDAFWTRLAEIVTSE